MVSKNSSYGKKDERTRNWNILVYPTKEYLDSIGSSYDGSDGYGSAPKNWKDILDEEHIQWVESPLHDIDLNPNGKLKKPHWHITLLFEGKKSFEQIKELTDKLNSPIPQKCASAKGSVRYMAHLDNGDKAQYDKGLIIGHGGVDVAEYLKPTSSSRYQLISEMRRWVNDNNCLEFCELFDYAADVHFDDWFPLLCDNSAYIMGEFIKSRRNRSLAKEQSYKIDAETGEVLA